MIKNKPLLCSNMDGEAMNRYQRLRVQESLHRSCNYPSACRELALILKLCYSRFPKLLQSILLQDLLTAFRLLPRMQTHSAISAANALLQSVESALPKQKKALAVTEFKHAMVAHKRCSKSRSNEDLVDLPQDVLVHIFSFLDLQSLVSASQVCRSWNVASTDNHLWELIYITFFNNFPNNNVNKLYTDQEPDDWRSKFKKAYNGFPSKTYCRGLCPHCHEVVWVHDMGNQTTSRLKCKYHRIKLVSTSQIVEYIEGGYASSSDSDSDSDCDETFSKLWVYPRRGFSFQGHVRG